MHANVILPENLHFDSYAVNRVNQVRFLGFLLDSVFLGEHTLIM
jgi:hypothetical protein